MLKSYFVLHSYVTRLLNRDDRGATAVEYGLIVFLIAVAIIGAVTAVGGQLQIVFGDVATALGAV